LTEKSTGSVQKPRRSRDPEGTHERILGAAREVLAKHGAEGLSIDQVAERARVNRSTAYQHFPTRERLIDAASTSVSDNLCEAIFGNGGRDPPRKLTVEGVAENTEPAAAIGP